jgi:hypothetical protein
MTYISSIGSIVVYTEVGSAEAMRRARERASARERERVRREREREREREERETVERGGRQWRHEKIGRPK